jgi:hypothetical protein
MKMSKKKNKPCITEDQIRKVLEETVMTCSSINRPEWAFCVETPGVFYWENIYNKTRIGAHLNQNDDAWEIYKLNLTYVVYIRIYINNRSIIWEGYNTNSVLQPYMHDAFMKLSELIKDESAESKVVDTSERKLISAKELENFLMNNIVREFIEGLFADTPYAPPSITYEWRDDDNGDVYHFGYRYKEDIPHWEIFTSKNDKSKDNVNINIYRRNIVFMKESSEFQAVCFNRMLKLFNDLAKEFDLKKFYDAEESEVPQEVVKAETNKSKITEGEKEMENEDNYIKMDGEKDSFEGGAIRYTKKGKGRYDLIPSCQIHDILDYAKTNWDNIIGKDDKFCSIYNVLMSAYPDTDDLSYNNYIEIIINIIRYCYIVASNNQNFYAFVMGFVEMLKDLAIHYEMGAEKYGVDNWKNGIPVTKGERGGSFRDSGLRHLQQLLDGQTDEPHQIAAIWNFIGAMYVIRNLIDTISGKKHRDTCENHDEMKNSDGSKIYNDIKALLGDAFEDDDQDINHLIEDMMSDTVIDLSHPDPDMDFKCFLMGNIHTNNFGIVFNPNDKKDWHIFNKNKVSITVFREYCNNLECDRFEITGIDIHGVQCKLNIDRSSITNLDSEFNVKAELSTALEVKQAPQEVVLYKFDFRSTPKKIPKDLWDRFYYNFLSNAVEVRPV